MNRLKGSRLAAFIAGLTVTVVVNLSASSGAEAASTPGILMGEPQKANWEAGTSECKHLDDQYCADEISQGQFVAWPFVAEHSGTVTAIFAVLGTSVFNTGAEVGIYANRRYSYPEITFNGEKESSGETWTPARFMKYEAEIPPEDPGALLGTSGKVAESAVNNLAWTEFKLEHPVKVLKGEKYWLANTTFATVSESEDRRYQDFLHERLNTTEAQPWGDYSNEPTNWKTVVRPLTELPSPETTKINCEICNTTGWLQEEPKKFKLVNPNREAQEEGGQTYSYAYGTIEERAAPEAYSNGRPLSSSHVPFTGVGPVQLISETIGGVSCSAYFYGEAWNALVGGETRGVGEVDGLGTSGCKDPSYVKSLEETDKGQIERKEVACRGGYPGVKIGEGACFSIYVTTELPLEVEQTEALVCATEGKKLSECNKSASEKKTVKLISTLRRRATSTPWKGELIRGTREGEGVVLARTGLAAFGEAGANIDGQDGQGACYPKEAEVPASWKAVPSGCAIVDVILPQIPAEIVFYGSQELWVINGSRTGLFPSTVRLEDSGMLFSSANLAGENNQTEGSVTTFGSGAIELLTSK
jgi:hypothetical protein